MTGALSLGPLATSVPLLLVALLGFTNREVRPRYIPRLAEGSALLAFFLALASLAALVLRGSETLSLVDFHGLAVSFRADVLSVAMLLLVTFIGWIVVRYACTYLDGEARQGPFLGWLCLTLASVLLLVASGNLIQLLVAWVATSLCLHKLLLFYPDRVAARRAG